MALGALEREIPLEGLKVSFFEPKIMDHHLKKRVFQDVGLTLPLPISTCHARFDQVSRKIRQQHSKFEAEIPK